MKFKQVNHEEADPDILKRGGPDLSRLSDFLHNQLNFSDLKVGDLPPTSAYDMPPVLVDSGLFMYS